MQYEIFEGNIERLEKKILTIYNKCKAYGCNFHYAQVGETFKEVDDGKGNKYTARFIIVKAEGTAIINNWEFVAAVEHTENGNIFSGIQGIEVPEKYYDMKPVCEHCNTNRYRKYMYIIRNKETGEFKQVGKSCLKDFTHGMSAEAIAQYISLFDTMIQGETFDPGTHVEHYLNIEEYLAYVSETIRCFGYVRSADGDPSTAAKALDYYKAARGQAASREYLRYLEDEMTQLGFDVESQETVQKVKAALEWIEQQYEHTNYIHNLKTVCSLEYTTYKNAGLLASLFVAYKRGLEKEAINSQDDESNSVYVGKEGDKITIKARSARCMTSYETKYGTRRIYKIIGKDGNVYIWKTGNVIMESGNITVTGTVKDHTEFRGIKQTELTRCYITKSEE